ERLRIGYISADLRRHSTASTSLGWLRRADRTRFELYCYHAGQAADLVTEEFRAHSDHFHHIPEDVEAMGRQIAADRLHVLVYVDIGTFPATTMLAGLRLAPVQCTTVGNPVTS